MKDLENIVRDQIKKDLGIDETKLSEAYVTQAKQFDLSTELLSSKTKQVDQALLDEYVATLNHMAASLDTADKDNADSFSSKFRSLKLDETYNLNGAFLMGLYLENISDLQSRIAMDSLAFLRLERDFGTFDEWQKDFIACALSSRNGWVVTVYNCFLNRYMNCVIDSNDANVPINSYPIIVLSMHGESFQKDYLGDKKAYIYAMMKELNWEKVEKRFQKAEKIAKVAQ